MLTNYPKELKLLVCKEITENNRKPKTIAKNYNINLNTLYSWLSRYKKDRDPFIGKGHRRDEKLLLNKINDLEEEISFYRLILDKLEK